MRDVALVPQRLVLEPRLGVRAHQAGQPAYPLAADRVRRSAWLAAILVVVALGGWQRAAAVLELPPDYDELVYLPVSFRYAERMTAGRWCSRARRAPWRTIRSREDAPSRSSSRR